MSLVFGRLGVWGHLGTAHPGAPGLVLREGDGEELRRWLRSSRIPAARARRARIVLLAPEGVANTHIANRVEVARQTVLT